MLSLIDPTTGNHEYKAKKGVPDCGGDTASGYFQYFGAVAGPPPYGWHGFDLGPDWHFIALNSDCRPTSYPDPGPCTTEDRDAWLAGHLAGLGPDVDKKCMVAYRHHPRFSSSRTLANVGANAWTRPSWELLYAQPASADLILNGHAHMYERFRPRTPLGDDDPTNGIRSLTIGTGGVAVPSFASMTVAGGTFDDRAVTRQDRTYGVGQFVLYDRPNPSDSASRGSYNYQFTPDPTITAPARRR